MNNEALLARYSALQDELAAAPNHMMDTAWWADRIQELQNLAAQLGW